MEGCEDLANHRNGAVESGVAEEYPAKTYEVEGYKHSRYLAPTCTAILLRAMQQTAQAFMQRQSHSVQSAPYYKVPRSSVPQSSQQHGENQVDVGTQLTLTVSA